MPLANECATASAVLTRSSMLFSTCRVSPLLSLSAVFFRLEGTADRDSDKSTAASAEARIAPVRNSVCAAVHASARRPTLLTISPVRSCHDLTACSKGFFSSVSAILSLLSLFGGGPGSAKPHLFLRFKSPDFGIG